MIYLRLVRTQHEIPFCHISRVGRIVDQYPVPRSILRRTRNCHLLVPLIGQVKLLVATIDHASISKSTMHDNLTLTKSKVFLHSVIIESSLVTVYQIL